MDLFEKNNFLMISLCSLSHKIIWRMKYVPIGIFYLYVMMIIYKTNTNRDGPKQLLCTDI